MRGYFKSKNCLVHLSDCSFLFGFQQITYCRFSVFEMILKEAQNSFAGARYESVADQRGSVTDFYGSFHLSD